MARAFVTGLGIVSPAGKNVFENLESLRSGKTCIGRLALFEFDADGTSIPAGEIRFPINDEPGLPRTHSLALVAAMEALGDNGPPDAIIIGSTTGGMPLSETLLKDNDKNPEMYNLHATGTIADLLASRLGCKGPALSVSTACSSGAVAVKAALEMIRLGRARRVLAGGVDALCRLTVNGFFALQLIDANGCRPFDKNRLGMTVGEGAGMLLIEASDSPPENALAELVGGGLSCDAFHATKPHPDGEGAITAMKSCLEDAGLLPEEIDYINLHGTGTPDNDAVEAMAVKEVFSERNPYASSTKGITGHTLAAAGAIEACFACLAVKHGFVPGNTGFVEPDEALGFTPVKAPFEAKIGAALSNSFGFGGNNAAVAFARPEKRSSSPEKSAPVLKVRGISMITGSGHFTESIRAIEAGTPCAGKADLGTVAKDLPPRLVRRLGRLSQLALALGAAAHAAAGSGKRPSQVFFGTGLGGLSETSDFLNKIFTTGGKFGSPTDFVGSVHNAPAGQVALYFTAKGANVTSTSLNSSFEQALYIAELMMDEDAGDALLIAADESHPVLTPLLDRSANLSGIETDGGGAFLVSAEADASGPHIKTAYIGPSCAGAISRLLDSLHGSEGVNSRFAAVFAGMPAEYRDLSEKQLEEFLFLTSFPGVVFDYRKITGEFGSASAVAAAASVHFVKTGVLPASIAGQETNFMGKGILILGLGSELSAVEIVPG